MKRAKRRRSDHKRAARAPRTSHLVVADGDRRVQKVPDLPEVLESLFLQCHPFTVGFPNGLVHQQPHFLNLGYCQGLARKNTNDDKESNKLRVFRTEMRCAGSHTANVSAVTDSRSCASSGRVSSSPTGSFFYIHKISSEQHMGHIFQLYLQGAGAPLLYLHFLPDALAAEVLDFVEVVCSEAACEGKHHWAPEKVPVSPFVAPDGSSNLPSL